MVNDLESPWAELCTAFQRREDCIYDIIQDLWDWALQIVETELSDSDASVRTLSEALQARQRLIRADIEQVWHTFQSNLARLRTYVLSGIQTSLIGQAMAPAYQAAMAEYGSGSDRRRKTLIGTPLGDITTFQTILREFQKAFHALATELQQEIENVVTKHLDVIHGTLEIVRSENVAQESEQDPGFRDRVANEVAKTQAEIRRIRDEI